MSGLCAGFVACNEPKGPEYPEVIGVVPLLESDVPTDVSVFFKEHLNPALSDYFPREDDNNEPVFSTINSKEELKAVVPSSVELPEIDFEKYTLVIGRYMSTGGAFIESQSIDTEPDIMELNLTFGLKPGVAMMFWRDYCGLYPKLPQKPIVLNQY